MQTCIEEKIKVLPENIYLPRTAEIIRTERVTEKEKFFEIRFMDGSNLNCQPGQFVEVSVFGIGEAPISICSSPLKKGSFELCIREAGTVTSALHRMKAGDRLGIRGPFGNGFDVKAIEGKDIVIIGGGIGLVPLRSLIQYLIHHKNRYGKIHILHGAKTPSELLFNDELKEWALVSGVEVMITVDRPDPSWKGHSGVITTLIPPIEMNPVRTFAVIVGPPVMYKFVIMSLRSKNIPDGHIIVSLERRMKCGVGKCGHCQMNHLYVCQDGPVFNYAKIKNLKEAIS